MRYSDLHIHSSFSDGKLLPEQIINIAIEKKLKYIAITDHDTIESQYIVEENKFPDKINVIPGLEISTEYMHREIHLLGYFIDIKNNELKQNLNKVKVSRIERAKEIIDRLNELDINIEFKEISKTSSIGRPHIAKLIVEKGFANNTKEAFQLYLIQGKPGYAERYKIDYKKALKLINDSGGIAVLAHPGEIYKGLAIERIIKEFKVYGLKGIEVFHPSHSSIQINDFYNLAKKYSLAITGGSDCHGFKINNNLLIGTFGLNEELTEKFLNQNNRFGGSKKWFYLKKQRKLHRHWH